MNTNENTREKISALADGELPDPHIDSILAALRTDTAKAEWELYHLIGDALRSDEVADMALSSDFAARMAARLEAEPPIVAPVMPKPAPQQEAAVSRSRKWALPGMAAAIAMASAAFVATPHLMVASTDEGQTLEAAATAARDAEVDAVLASSSSKEAVPDAPVAAASATGDVILRDPRIDDYLLAHQRFSPSVYSTAQYARSATFATESGK